MPLRTFEPCIPVRGTTVPLGPEWFDEIKHDGYRVIIRREDKCVRLFTRNGYDWSSRFRRIVEAALALPASSFVIDGEAVLCADNGVSDFAKLYSRGVDREVFSYGFDLLSLAGEDLRPEPLERRKTKLWRLLAKSRAGIVLSGHLEGDRGPAMFDHACCMGLEGIVSKHRARPYRAGKSKHWVKVKNPSSPAMTRVLEGSW